MAKSDADADGNRKINKSLSMFWAAGDFLLTASWDNCCRLRGWRRNFVKCVIFPHFGQACVVAYLTPEMRSDYAKCVMVGKSAMVLFQIMVGHHNFQSFWRGPKFGQRGPKASQF